MYGWAGKILRVNLTTGTVTREPLPEEVAHKFVGGRGLNGKYLYDEVRPGTDPLGPDNKIFFGVGPVCGTLVPGSQRYTVTAKSPLSGFFGDGNCGGSFGAGLKYAGYDMLIVEGKSERPLYLFIDGDSVQLRDAAYLWGKTTSEARGLIEKEIGDPGVHIAGIGPAGENLIRFASVLSDNRASGRTGMGAVMGSKNLKAVAARGNKGVRVANPEMLEETCQEMYKIWHGNAAALKGCRVEGPGVGGSVTYNRLGILPTRHYREGVFEGFESIRPGRLPEEYWLKPRSCFSCPVACSHVYIIGKGQYAGTLGEGLYATTAQFGSNIGVSDCDFVVWAASFTDQQGIDVMNFAEVIGWTIECLEAGILTEKDLGGLKLKWGDCDSIRRLMEMIVHREGIGNLLAEGSLKAAQKIGKGSEKYVMAVKGMSIDSRDPRGSKGWALGYAVSSRGADHCRSSPPDFMGSERHVEPTWLRDEIKGFKGMDRLAEAGKGEVHKWYEDLRGFQHSLAVCYFTFETVKDITHTELLARYYNAVTGLKIDGNEVKKIGERIMNLERAFNVREGLTRKDDMLPERFLKEPLRTGESAGQLVNLDLMLDEYYDFRGWDRATGYPTRKKLVQLGLKDVADELAGMGRLG